MKNKNVDHKKIYLASTSPRRKELLSQLGVAFTCISPEVDETPWPGEAPASFALRAASDKAHAADRQIGGASDGVIISADTIVVVGGEVLGKPRDGQHASAMLKKLSGRQHIVMTGLCLLRRKQGEWIERGLVVQTEVGFRDLTTSEIDCYIATGEPMDKAGAYAIQGGAEKFVIELRGSRSNVVGLPMEELVPLLNMV